MDTPTGAASWIGPWEVMLILLVWILPIFVARRVGRRRNREWAFLWGLFLSWAGVMILILLPQTAPAASTKRCPECAESVLAEAKRCRFCGHRFEAA